MTAETLSRISHSRVWTPLAWILSVLIGLVGFFLAAESGMHLSSTRWNPNAGPVVMTRLLIGVVLALASGGLSFIARHRARVGTHVVWRVFGALTGIVVTIAGSVFVAVSLSFAPNPRWWGREIGNGVLEAWSYSGAATPAWGWWLLLLTAVMISHTVTLARNDRRHTTTAPLVLWYAAPVPVLVGLVATTTLLLDALPA